MRLATVRTDIQKIYLSDIENASQRNFSSQPKGQSRYIVRPTDAQLLAILEAGAKATLVGSNTSTFNTTGSNATKLNIRTIGSGAYTQVTVRSGAAVTAAQIVSDLNIAFQDAGILATARITGTSVAIDTVAGGPAVDLDLDASSPSTAALQTVLGLSTTAVPGISVATLKAAIYPTAVTANVASATILALGSLTNMSTADKASLVTAVQDAVAPRVVETGLVLRSYSYGVISQLRSATFRPGGARVGLPAGLAVYVLEDDGSTAFTI